MVQEMVPALGATRREASAVPPVRRTICRASAAPAARTHLCGWWVVLALVLYTLSLSSAEIPPNATCLVDGTEARARGVAARSARVRLLWQTQPARAAAALLRATLLAAGHRPEDVTLEYSAAAGHLCDLLAANFSGAGAGVSLVSVAVALEPHCVWTGHPLQVVGAGAAPLVPRLHARLSRDAAALALCNFTIYHYLREEHTLRQCGFLNGTDTNVTVYTLHEEWKEETAELRDRLRSARVVLASIPRDELKQAVEKEDGRSFLFLDAEVWSEQRDVIPPPAPRAAASLLVASKTALLIHAPALYTLLYNATFAPSGSDLRAVLAHTDLETEACNYVSRARDYRLWVNTTTRPSERRAFVLICDPNEFHDYDTATCLVLPYHINQTMNLPALKAMFLVDVVSINCDRPYALSDMLTEWYNNGTLWRTVGVVTPAEQVEAGAEAKATAHRIPLLSYTPAAANTTTLVTRSATGGVKQLVKALVHLLSRCGWTRLGVVSEDTALARAVSGELASHGLLTLELSAEAPLEAVRALRDNDTRIYFVNCEARAAAAVLKAAAANASSNRHVWIVREYERHDEATAALKPLSVSFQWRGGDELERRWTASGAPQPEQVPGRYLLGLAREWQHRAWPRHAAAAMDALLALAQGFERLVHNHAQVLDDPLMEDKLSFFWEGLQSTPVSGLLGDLQYDERGVKDACVYIERWDASERPLRLAAWGACGPGAQDLPSCPVPAVADGTSRCVARAGDPYHPRCYDGAWIGGGAALGVALAALWFAAVALRRWLERRDRRLERATTAKILAQREVAFAELAEHLVARGDLLLGEEIGAGRFGRVRRGEVAGRTRSVRRRQTVAVKTLREGASPAEESQFLREARLLSTLDHEHVVRFRGLCWEGGPPLLLMELALFGDLLQYLRARRHLAEGAESADAEEATEGGAGPDELAAVSAESLTRLAREAAFALAYLGSRGLVHRDVRAANCLVDARRSLKLADFGLARETGAEDGEYACRGRALFPVLWMAPESLARGVATAASDAWSFGVLALELVTLGARPFGGAAPEAAVRAVLAGGRPPLPRDACAETRALALACWRRDPADRPAAARLASWLARRTTALRPALAPDLEEPDCDSGIGEQDAHAPHYDPAASTDRRSVSLLMLTAHRNLQI